MITANAFAISDWKPFVKNTLRGFFTVTLPSGMILHGCSFHEQNDSRWVGLPAREYVKDGAKSWVPVVEFTSKEARERFQIGAITALTAHLDAQKAAQP